MIISSIDVMPGSPEPKSWLFTDKVILLGKLISLYYEVCVMVPNSENALINMIENNKYKQYNIKELYLQLFTVTISKCISIRFPK